MSARWRQLFTWPPCGPARAAPSPWAPVFVKFSRETEPHASVWTKKRTGIREAEKPRDLHLRAVVQFESSVLGQGSRGQKVNVRSLSQAGGSAFSLLFLCSLQALSPLDDARPHGGG